MGVGEMEVVRKNGCRFTIHKRSIAELTPKEGHVFLSFLNLVTSILPLLTSEINLN